MSKRRLHVGSDQQVLVSAPRRDVRALGLGAAILGMVMVPIGVFLPLGDGIDWYGCEDDCDTGPGPYRIAGDASVIS